MKADSRLPLSIVAAVSYSRHGLPKGRYAVAGNLFLIGLSCASSGASAEYRLAAGDAVEIAIAGLPDGRQRATIQPDGTVALTRIGRVTVAGLTGAELQARMEKLLPTRLHTQQAPDGRERVVPVRPADVSATIAEFRPVYVTGDVLTPGQHQYRPLMTIRQAVAVSGGYSTVRARLTRQDADPIEVRRDHASLSLDYIKEHFHVLRLGAELTDKDTFDQRPPPGVAVPNSVMVDVVRSEAESLRVSRADFQGETAFLERAIRQADEHIRILGEQEQGEKRGVEADTEELERLLKLLTTGNTVSQRVSESRRALLLSSTRRLQTSAALIQVIRQKADHERQLERIANLRRINLLKELRDSDVRIADLSLRLQAATDKLRMATGTGDVAPEIHIVRSAGSAWTRSAAGEDTELEPGDVIEVSLPVPPFRAAAAR